VHALAAIASRRIAEEDHERFGAFSGDLNPIHADAVAARSMEPGGLLAYGMDLLLWALEALAGQGRPLRSVARVRARFVRGVYLEDVVELRQAGEPRAALEAFELTVKGISVLRFDLFLGERSAMPRCGAPELTPIRRRVPRDLKLEELAGREGEAALASPAEALLLYPRLAEYFGPHAVAEFAACSYIIGMEAPGLRSMSMRYDLQLTNAVGSGGAGSLHYRVTDVDERFRKATIAVSGTHIWGTLEAFVRA
jgi:hypothetical protein